jgi:RNA ligase (TIGR02306 family)
VFGVCSRNIRYLHRINNNWWNAAVNNSLPTTLPDYCKIHKVSLAIQGEIIGPGIQGNKYELEHQHLFVYSVWDIEHQRYVQFEQKKDICHSLKLSMVPLLGFVPPTVRFDSSFFLELAKDKSVLRFAVPREGIVVRDMYEDSTSFKAINNDFLLRYDHA